MQRTKYCGLFGEEDVGKQVTAMGWVQTCLLYTSFMMFSSFLI